MSNAKGIVIVPLRDNKYNREQSDELLKYFKSLDSDIILSSDVSPKATNSLMSESIDSSFLNKFREELDLTSDQVIQYLIPVGYHRSAIEALERASGPTIFHASHARMKGNTESELIEAVTKTHFNAVGPAFNQSTFRTQHQPRNTGSIEEAKYLDDTLFATDSPRVVAQKLRFNNFRSPVGAFDSALHGFKQGVVTYASATQKMNGMLSEHLDEEYDGALDAGATFFRQFIRAQGAKALVSNLMQKRSSLLFTHVFTYQDSDVY